MKLLKNYLNSLKMMEDQKEKKSLNLQEDSLLI
jgi:hypothetical protein